MFAGGSASASPGSSRRARTRSRIRCRRGRSRKDAYIARVREEHDDSALRVSVADKLNNTRTLLRAVKFPDDPASVWDRSEQGRDCVLWYYRSIERAFRSRMQSPLLEELDAVVSQLEIVAGGPSAGCTG